MLSDLRAALRTEPNVRLAVLFGSLATGEATEHSDADVLVQLADQSMVRVAELTGRLEQRSGRDVQLVRFQEAERNAALMRDVVEEGRVLVDRDERWPALKATATRWRRRAEAEDRPLIESMPDLELP